MRILGIDPGFGRVGWGVIDVQGGLFSHCAHGLIETSAEDVFPKRLDHIARALQKICKKYHPDIMGVEELFFAKNVTTAIQVGHARGVILLEGLRAKLRIAEVTPLEVKRTVTGYGKADKKQVQFMIHQAFSLPSTALQDDAADALAVALTVGVHAGRAGKQRT